jgi:hypothetical protein
MMTMTRNGLIHLLSALITITAVASSVDDAILNHPMSANNDVIN